MRTLLLTSIAVLAAATSPAHASGFRAELHAGGDRVSGGGHEDGVVYGIGAGYDFDISPKMTLGAEVNLDDSSVKECSSTGTGATAVRACAKAGRDIGVNARLGYKVSDAGTLYALAGYTNARAKGSVQTGTGPVTTASANADGLRLGLGYQHNLNQALYVKAEYRYSNYEAGGSRNQLLTGVGVRF